MSYIGNEPIVSATRTITEITATAGQTVFVANGGYTVGYIDVFLNGAQLQTVDFTATDGSSITLTEAAQVGDVIRLVAWGTFSTSNLVSPNYTGTLTGGTGVVNIGSGQFYKDASGNVGVGTSSPLVPLHVVTTGTGTAMGDNVSTTLRSTASGRASTLQLSDGTTSGYMSMVGGVLGFASGGSTERMRIDSSGNLLVRTTTADGLKGWAFLSTANTEFITVVANSTIDGATHMSFRTAGVQKGYIAVSGGSTIYSTSSDYRLKENIQPMTGALNKVMQLKPVTYRWIEEQVDSQGFIAHELQEVVPQCVMGEKDAVDAEGKPVYQGIDTSFLVATLAAAIQEQQAQLTDMSLTLANANAIITDLKQRIETLESK